MSNITVIIDGEEVSSTTSLFGDADLEAEVADALHGRNRLSYSKPEED